MNPYELHPEDRKKMKNKTNKNKIDISRLKSIIEEYKKDFKIEKARFWGYNKQHIDKILAEIIAKVEEETKNDS